MYHTVSCPPHDIFITTQVYVKTAATFDQFATLCNIGLGSNCEPGSSSNIYIYNYNIYNCNIE